MKWILFYYNSLPDLPKECSIFNPNVMYRDFIKCNPTNTNHYEYPRFETLSYDEGCHTNEVKRFLKNPDPEKYVIFYTRHTNIYRESTNKVVGYFKVGKYASFNGKNGFYSSESVLLPKRRCIEIEYKSRGVPVSWGSSSIKNKINEIFQYLQRIKNNPELNIYLDYQKETKKIMDMLKTKSGREKLFNYCMEKCKDKKSCLFCKKLLRKRLSYLDDLYKKYDIQYGKGSSIYSVKFP